jgi:hypothetical protein
MSNTPVCKGLAPLLGLFQPVAAFGQVQRCGQFAKLRQGQGDDHLIPALAVQLAQRDAILKSGDDNILAQRLWAGGAFINQRYNRGVKVVFYRKHSVRLTEGRRLGKR